MLNARTEAALPTSTSSILSSGAWKVVEGEEDVRVEKWSWREVRASWARVLLRQARIMVRGKGDSSTRRCTIEYPTPLKQKNEKRSEDQLGELIVICLVLYHPYLKEMDLSRSKKSPYELAPVTMATLRSVVIMLIRVVERM